MKGLLAFKIMGERFKSRNFDETKKGWYLDSDGIFFVGDENGCWMKFDPNDGSLLLKGPAGLFKIDLKNARLLVHDGETWRVLIGKF